MTATETNRENKVLVSPADFLCFLEREEKKVLSDYARNVNVHYIIRSVFDQVKGDFKKEFQEQPIN